MPSAPQTVSVPLIGPGRKGRRFQETIVGDFRKHGFELVSVSEPDLCSDDPCRKLVRQVFGAIAEYGRAMIVLKLHAARQRKRQREGRSEGRKPFGHRAGEQTLYITVWYSQVRA